MEEVLQLARKKAEQAEVYSVTFSETPASFEANRLKMLQTRQTWGIALRIVRNGRIGFSATNDPNDKKGLVDRAVEISQFGAEAKFQLPGRASYPEVNVYDPDVERVEIEKMVEMGQSMIDTVRAFNSDVLCEAGVTRGVGVQVVMNSNGGSATYKKSVFSLGVDGTLIRGTDMLFVGESKSWCKPVFDMKHITDTVIKQLELAKDTVAAPSGEVPVVFTPHGVANAMVHPLSLALNGKTVLQGASPLAGKLGQKVFDERFSVLDDSTIELCPGSRMCDDEGVPSEKIALIKNGVLGSFLYDLQTAGLAGARSTGSAARGLGSLPSPSLGVMVIGTGDARYDDMIADIKEGLVVEQLLGAGQGNVLGGEMGGNVLLGYKIENGRIVGRVKDTVISGNIYQALNKVIAIGKEAQWVGGSMLTPAICCKGITVASKG